MIQAVDLVQSYEKDSDGRSSRSVISFEGKPILGESIWLIGEDAINILRNSFDEVDGDSRKRIELTVAELLPKIPEAIKALGDFLNTEFYPNFVEAFKGGAIQCNVDIDTFCEYWAEYHVASKAQVFFQLFAGNPTLFPEESALAPLIRTMAATAVILRIDDAAIAAFMDGDGLDDVIIEIERLRNHLSPPMELNALIAAAKKNAFSERARESALVGHTKTNQAREWILHEWRAHPRFTGLTSQPSAATT